MRIHNLWADPLRLRRFVFSSFDPVSLQNGIFLLYLNEQQSLHFLNRTPPIFKAKVVSYKKLGSSSLPTVHQHRVLSGRVSISENVKKPR